MEGLIFMSLTEQQLFNYLDDNVRFRFDISTTYTIDFDSNKDFSFKSFYDVVNKNLKYWRQYSETEENTILWKNISDKLTNIKTELLKYETLKWDDVDNLIWRYSLSNNQTQENDKRVLGISIHSPIIIDKKFNLIRKFVDFYVKYSESNVSSAVVKYIYLLKNPNQVGSYLAKPNDFYHYPAVFHLKEILNIKIPNIDELEDTIIQPFDEKVQSFSDDADKKYAEIVKFAEQQHQEVSERLNSTIQNLADFKESINNWEKEKTQRLHELEETYKEKLSLEAPEELWKSKAEDHTKKAQYWLKWLIGVSVVLILCSTFLISKIYEHKILDNKLSIPFISETFIVFSAITFLIYIIRTIVKVMISHQHLATEYSQKAAMTHFYQALLYKGATIENNERLIIINALFTRIDTGLVKTDNGSDLDTLLSIITKK